MYGLIGRILAQPGQRDALAHLMAAGMPEMPGCLSYVVAPDTAEADAIWISEVWDSAQSHAASLQIPAVQALIGQARPMIAGMDSRVETTPLAGVNAPKSA